MCYTGKDYEMIGSRQQCRRRELIKEKIINFAAPLQTSGLQVVSVQLQTHSKKLVHLQLVPGEKPQLSNMDQNSELIPNIAYLLLRYGVSMECYHELSMVVDGLPKSYKVMIQLYM